MTPAHSEALQPSPWRTVWTRPGDTIARILAIRPTHHVLLLAALGTVAAFVSQLIDRGFTVELLEWRILGAVVLGGAVIGVVMLYVYALLFKWSGRIFGGRASARDLRAVFAWSVLPNLVGLLICLAVLIALRLSGDAAPRPLAMALQGVMVAAGLWSLVMLLIMFARAQNFGFWRTVASAVVGGLLVFLFLAFPLSVRTFVFQPFSLPAGSMKPTLLIGDYVFVSKYSYGYSRFSLPYSLPLWSGRVLASEPERGDLVVFRLPKDVSTDYIKRVVGLPGDRVQMVNGLLHINGAAVKRERMDDFVDTSDGRTVRVKRWRETLSNGAGYETLDVQDNGFLDNTQVYNVPPGHYFMLGDNRDNSTDSRVLSQVGYVPFENIVGRVRLVYMSVDRESGTVPLVRNDRLGLLVR